ncbi:MAG: peptidoglycan-binding protein [Pseudomonadota bacterium]|nr:peptidoglycan-binding protein [Pseudomonadota bacterium]
MRSIVRHSEPNFATLDDDPVDEFNVSLRHSRKDWFIIGALVLCVVAISINALFLQTRPHPAPMFVNRPPQVASAAANDHAVSLPRPRPARVENTTAAATASARARADIVADIQRELARRGFFEGNADGVYGPKTDAAIRDFEQVAGFKTDAEPSESLLRTISQSRTKAAPAALSSGLPANALRPPDPIAELIAPSKRVTAVQRVLSEFGYGQIAPNGVLDHETEVAIEQFERQRKLPVTGQITPRLLRELAALSGRPVD